MKKMTIIMIMLLATALSGCVSTHFHFVRWDYVPKVGWRPMLYGQQQDVCFDEQSGDTLPACQGCYDANKQPLPGCVPGHYEISLLKAAADAKINDKIIEDHCRSTAYGCMCTGLAYPWTDAQKKTYPSCDPRKPASAESVP